MEGKGKGARGGGARVEGRSSYLRSPAMSAVATGGNPKPRVLLITAASAVAAATRVIVTDDRPVSTPSTSSNYK